MIEGRGLVRAHTLLLGGLGELSGDLRSNLLWRRGGGHLALAAGVTPPTVRRGAILPTSGEGPHMAKAIPGLWMFTKKVLPSGENVHPASSESFRALRAKV